LVHGIRRLARKQAASADDWVLLRRIEMAMEDEAATFQERRAAAARQAVGA
jgi:hypothetical protein